MLNDHLVFALFFFFVLFTYFYGQWLQDIPENFPGTILMAVVIGIFVTFTPLRTMLKEADLVFLLPTEHRLGTFFRNGLLYTYAATIYPVILVTALFAPLHFALYPDRPREMFIGFISALLIFKAWNLLSHWWELNSRNLYGEWVDRGIRYVLTTSSLFFILSNQWVFAAITTILLFAFMMYAYVQAKQNKGVAWDVLIEKEQARMQSFYRFANLFTDVPHLKQPVKKRAWITPIVKRGVSFKQSATYDYLFRITFARSDYLGLYMRLLFIGVALVAWAPNVWAKIVFALIFLYLSGFQMVPLWSHHEHLEWSSLYPITKEQKKAAIKRWLFQLLLVKTFLLSLAFLVGFHWVGIPIVWIAGAVISYVLVYLYLPRRIA